MDFLKFLVFIYATQPQRSGRSPTLPIRSQRALFVVPQYNKVVRAGTDQTYIIWEKVLSYV